MDEFISRKSTELAPKIFLKNHLLVNSKQTRYTIISLLVMVSHTDAKNVALSILNHEPKDEAYVSLKTLFPVEVLN